MTEGGRIGQLPQQKKTPFFVGTYEPENLYNSRRYAFTLRFLQNLSGSVLDCGEPNILKEMIENKFSLKISSTGESDLDVSRISGKYDIVLAFEIIEHLMNPLWFLMQARESLNPDGVVYLSTPINKPKFLWRHDHFHEFDEYRLTSLVDKAGFIVHRKQRAQFYSKVGIRPLIRLAFRTGTMFLELRSKTEATSVNK